MKRLRARLGLGSAFAAVLACALVLGAVHGCAPDSTLPSPKVTAIEPAGIEAGQSVELHIRGEGFYPRAQRKLGQGVTVEDGFRARLGDAALDAVVRSSDAELTGQSPATLAPGVYTLLVEAPNGTATLEDAFTVWPPGACDGGCPDGGFDAGAADGSVADDGGGGNDGGNGADAGDDAGFDAGGGNDGGLQPFPYTPSNFDPAALPVPKTSADFTGCVTGFDTSADTWYQPCAGAGFDITHVTLPSGQQATVLSTVNLTIPAGALFGLYGTRPAILAVFGDATITGELWANSTTILYPRDGPGANPPSCGAQTGRAGSTIRSGGGGGAFGTRGWPGGSGGAAAPGADGGVPLTVFMVEPLRGGCAGGNGGGGAVAGSGGGALQLSVAGQLRVQSVISVSGAAGRGGTSQGAGGSGGGSGGMLLLEGAAVRLEAGAILSSNGGGGGGGSRNWVQAGSPGDDGWTDGGVPAAGGTGGTGAGAGGYGAALLDAGSAGGASAAQGGGGGGGGLGVIFVRSQPGGCAVDPTALFSPPAQTINCP